MEIVKIMAVVGSNVWGSIEVHLQAENDGIWTAYVQPRRRQEKLGSVLLERALRYMKERGRRGPILLKVRRDNAGAIKLYRNYGFRCMHRSPENCEVYVWMKITW